MVDDSSKLTTLPRRVLGRRLREMREHNKLSRAKAAQQCEMGSQTLWRLESGRSSEVKKMVINALCDLYRADDNDRKELLWLAKESRKDGWWQSYTDAIVPEFELFVGLEHAARRVFSCKSALLPGLLQTPDYRRAVWEIQGHPVRIDRDIDLITKRQEHLSDTENFSLDVVFNESVLRQNIGGKEVMVPQLKKILEVSELPNVSLQVISNEEPIHVGILTNDFVYLEFPDHLNPALTEPPVVYVECFTGALYLDKEDEIERYRSAGLTLRRVAMDEHDSRRLIKAILKESCT